MHRQERCVEYMCGVCTYVCRPVWYRCGVRSRTGSRRTSRRAPPCPTAANRAHTYSYTLHAPIIQRCPAAEGRVHVRPPRCRYQAVQCQECCVEYMCGVHKYVCCPVWYRCGVRSRTSSRRSSRRAPHRATHVLIHSIHVLHPAAKREYTNSYTLHTTIIYRIYIYIHLFFIVFH